jgi:hypothetical protein
MPLSGHLFRDVTRQMNAGWLTGRLQAGKMQRNAH